MQSSLKKKQLNEFLLPPSCIVNLWKKGAGNDGGPAACRVELSHEFLQDLFIIVVVTGEGVKLVLQTDLHSEGHLRVFQIDQET